MPYTPPLTDMMFTLSRVIGLDELPEHPELGKLDEEMVGSILEPASKLAAEVLAPLNKSGDENGAFLEDGEVTTAPGFKEAYGEYRDGGWNAVPFAPDFGGQGLPWLVAFAVQEMWQGANMSFGLCPLLNQGAVDAILEHGSEEQKQTYLEKLISGEWTGTMNLTEPQAGSDLAQVRSKAVPQEDGTYKVTGQKIFITYGEHDMAENIIHLVLARTPEAPEGVKGISLFIVPKFLEDGSRNDLVCAGLEHKMGIHASPTCTMSFGDNGGATGSLVGAENEGLKYMFTMMNNARLSVGLQGVAIAEASTQHAIDYARERIQGASLTDKASGPVAIINHADVKRMILTMQALTQAGRALTYKAALNLDLAHGGDQKAQVRVELLTPIVKGWCTDLAQEVSYLGVQVHGGMGFVEETGAAQFMRDARILPIYEGTNGIQALDLAFRKILKDGGTAVQDYIGELENDLKEISGGKGDDFEVITSFLTDALGSLKKALQGLGPLASENPDYVAAGALPLLSLFGTVSGGFMLAVSALRAQEDLEAGQGDPEFLDHQILLARFYVENILPRAGSYEVSILNGGKTISAAQL